MLRAYLLALFLTIFWVCSTLAYPVDDRQGDFRYPPNPRELDNLPMATVRPSVNPCN